MKNLNYSLLLSMLLSANVYAQSSAPSDTDDFYKCNEGTENTKYDSNIFEGNTFKPGKGFEVGKNKCGSLNISAYMLARWINQASPDQNYTNHMGDKKTVSARNDIEFHRVLVWLSGFMYSPKLKYQLMLWSLNSNDSTIIVGNIFYDITDTLMIGVGVDGMPGARSNNGQHPYFLGTDRQLAEEFFRPGFTNALTLRGALSETTRFRLMVANNLSQLGMTANELTRDFSYGATFWWMPTTGEFGEKSGYGDFEIHQNLATRFGISASTSKEDRTTNELTGGPKNTQVRLSDGTFLFSEGALAKDATVQKAQFDLVALDAGMKYKGFFLFTEFYWRQLTNFQTLKGSVPSSAITDKGMLISTSYQFIPKTLEVYLSHSSIWGQHKDATEFAVGANYYPHKTRNFRVNGTVMAVDNAPTGGNFGYYTVGQSGMIYSIGTDIYF